MTTRLKIYVEGTRKDNCADRRRAHGTMPRGERDGAAKLTYYRKVAIIPGIYWRKDKQAYQSPVTLPLVKSTIYLLLQEVKHGSDDSRLQTGLRGMAIGALRQRGRHHRSPMWSLRRAPAGAHRAPT